MIGGPSSLEALVEVMAKKDDCTFIDVEVMCPTNERQASDDDATLDRVELASPSLPLQLPDKQVHPWPNLVCLVQASRARRRSIIPKGRSCRKSFDGSFMADEVLVYGT